MKPKRVRHNKQTVWYKKKQVWYIDEKLCIYHQRWIEIENGETIETYDHTWQGLVGSDELVIYDNPKSTEIGTVADFLGGDTPTYTITWKNYDGTVLETDTGVERGTTPTYNGETPTKPDDQEYSYSFDGWSPAVGPAKKDQVYTAQYEATPLPPVPTYTITWKNYDETTLETDTVREGTIPTYDGATPTREGYSFTGWSPTVGPATADATYTAQFEPIPVTYTIIWQDWDGTTLETDTVLENTTPTYDGAEPTREGYTFSGWSPTVAPATQNQTYIAQYELVPQELNAKYLDMNCSFFSNGSDQYSGYKNMPGAHKDLNIYDDTELQKITLYKNSGGQSETEEITGADYTAYKNYMNELLLINGQITEEQFDHLWDFSEALDEHEYTVEIDPNNSNSFIFSKVLGATTEDTFTVTMAYGDIEGQWTWYIERTIGQASELATNKTYTDERIEQNIWNAINQTSGKLTSGNIYAFIKTYTLADEYITFGLTSEEDPTNTYTYQSSKQYLGGGETITQTGGQVVAVDGTGTGDYTITNTYNGVTYTITGQEATDDVMWMDAFVSEQETMTENDYIRFERLGVNLYRIGALDSSNIHLINDYENFQKEAYYLQLSNVEGTDVCELRYVQKDSYIGGQSETRFEYTTTDFATVYNEITTTLQLSAWEDLDSTEYATVKALIEAYKGSQIYNYMYNLWTNPSSSDMVVEILQERESGSSWNPWNKVEIHKDGNGGYYVTEMNDGGGMMQVGNMSASQYTDFGTAASSIGFDISQEGSQSINASDFTSLKTAVENNMSTNATAITSVTGFSSYTEDNPLLVPGVGETQTVTFTYAPANATNVATDLYINYESSYGPYNVVDGEVTSYANGTGTMVITGTRVGTAKNYVISTVGGEVATFYSKVLNNIIHTVTIRPYDTYTSTPNQGGTVSPTTMQVYDGNYLDIQNGVDSATIIERSGGISGTEISRQNFVITPDGEYAFEGVSPYNNPVTTDITIDANFSLDSY